MSMNPTTALRVLIVAAVALFAGARPAQAQITSGSVGGSVKDQQGGVVPGATVTLVSETRGTTSTPVVTNATGDFVFVNVPTDTYTVEVTMTGFKGLKRTGVPVSVGDNVAVGTLTLEVGGASETVNVTSEAARHPGAQRGAFLHRRDRVGRKPADRQSQLHLAGRARARRESA